MTLPARKLLCLLLISPVLFAGCAAVPHIPEKKDYAVPEDSGNRHMVFPAGERFLGSSACSTCHTHIYEQQSASMHAQSYSNSIFRAQYFNEILPAVQGSPAMEKEARSCGACHMPTAYLEHGKKVLNAEDIDETASGVTCDFCHRIEGYEGSQPGNGNYAAIPGSTKYGPYVHARSWHHMYHKLQTKSEFCATCHHGVNQHGVLVKPTYVEWKKSEYAKRKVQCQDCHMNVNGYLIDAKAIFESGKAADMVLGYSPDRRILYSHNFPGARTGTQITNAIPLRVKLSAGSGENSQTVNVVVEVDNFRTGHSAPSGSIELRYLWLDVHVLAGANHYGLVAASTNASGYDVSCMAEGDRAILGEDFPAGKRIYRAVFHDKAGHQTDSMVLAASKVFDNRLKAATVRSEMFTWVPPAGFHGNATVAATLYYVAYPDSFRRRLKLPPAENTIVSTSRNLLDVDASGSISFPMENTDW